MRLVILALALILVPGCSFTGDYLPNIAVCVGSCQITSRDTAGQAENDGDFASQEKGELEVPLVP